METKTSSLLSIRLAPLTSERLDAKLVSEGPALAACALLDDLPDWAPRRSYPSLEPLSPEPVDHYESWQGICW